MVEHHEAMLLAQPNAQPGACLESYPGIVYTGLLALAIGTVRTRRRIFS